MDDTMIVRLYTKRTITSCDTNYTIKSLIGKTVYYESCDDCGNILAFGVGLITNINPRLIDILDGNTERLETVYTESVNYIWDTVIVLW